MSQTWIAFFAGVFTTLDVLILLFGHPRYWIAQWPLEGDVE